MDLASSGFMSEFTKLLKYGIPYLPVISQSGCSSSSSQSKSEVRLYVGMGKVKILPLASPCIISSLNALLRMFISFWKSE